MRKHIYRFVLSILLFSLILFGAFQSVLNHKRYKKSAQQELQSVADVLSKSGKSDSEIAKCLEEIYPNKISFTILNADGSVIPDNDYSSDLSGNPLDYHDIRQAVKNNKGYSTIKKSISKYTYCYSIKTNNKIYRYSREINTITSEFIKTSIYLIIAIFFLEIITALLTKWYSKKLVAPISDITNKSSENESGKISTEYEELVPIADTITGLNRKLDSYRGKLKMESEKIALIFENMDEGLVILDSDGNISSINKSAVAMLAADKKIADTLNISELINDKQLLNALSLNEGERIQTVIEIGDKSVCAYINKLKIFSLVCIIIILADVTGKKNAEELRREFSANVSHELKTPLTTIKGFGELFGSGMITEPDDIKKYGSRIERESQRLLFLINDIIRLSELEETNEIITSNINLMSSAREAAEQLSQKAEKSDISLVFSGSETLCCNCNSNYINELFINLIDNSIKYNNPGGYVRINISDSENYAVISVKDNGIGIPDKDKDRIFERFYRVDKSHSRQTGGTGLGLSIVKHIVSYHDGKVNLKSKLGKGTEVKIYLPKNMPV